MPERPTASGLVLWHETDLSAPSFNHLVGVGEQLGWYTEAQRFRRLEIDHHFNFSALLDGEVGRLSALENLWRYRYAKGIP